MVRQGGAGVTRELFAVILATGAGQVGMALGYAHHQILGMIVAGAGAVVAYLWLTNESTQ